MIHYTSKDHILSLTKQYILDGESKVAITLDGKLDLSKLSERERQLVIATAKLIQNWTSGQRPDLRHKLPDGKLGRSLIDRFTAIAESEPKVSTKEEAKVPITETEAAPESETLDSLRKELELLQQEVGVSAAGGVSSHPAQTGDDK